ncbi:MAG: hypothetical protein KDA80_08745, partial [Planctomycetaceae bacterium]|nr:hypothetical protein [Planctomycetaceae bacterium]
VRQLAGWSSVALRAFDLLLLSSITFLLARLIRINGESWNSPRSAGLFLSLFGLYFSQSEWVHCQRDIWMLCPALLAVSLRIRHLTRVREALRPRFSSSFIEGALWAMAFWLKPHIAIPALAVFIVSWIVSRSRRFAVIDSLGILTGGAAIGALGSAWLINTEAWEPFWEMQLQWNPEYLQAGRQRLTWDRFASVWGNLAPWSWLHLVALPACVLFVFKAVKRRKDVAVVDGVSIPTLLMAALYLGWVTQVLLLQHPFAYVHLPPVILATAITLGIRVPESTAAWLAPAWTAFAALALLASPVASLSRLHHWGDCLTKGAVPEVQQEIQLQRCPDWAELRPVMEFLKQQQLEDGELTVYPGTAIVLYPQLNLRPPHRYVYLDAYARLFPNRVSLIEHTVASCGHRYIVSSLRDAGMSMEGITDEINTESMLPNCFPVERLNEFPYTQPVVFRSGQYCVHRVMGPLGPMCTEYLPLRDAVPVKRLNGIRVVHQGISTNE